MKSTRRRSRKGSLLLKNLMRESLARMDQERRAGIEKLLEQDHVLDLRESEDDEQLCQRCNGEGSYLYGGGSGWRGGMSTCTMTLDLCDVCWGSGTTTPFPNLREERKHHAEEVATASFERLIGKSYWKEEQLKPVVAVLRSICDGRTARGKLDFWGISLINCIVGALERVEEPKQETAKKEGGS